MCVFVCCDGGWGGIMGSQVGDETCTLEHTIFLILSPSLFHTHVPDVRNSWILLAMLSPIPLSPLACFPLCVCARVCVAHVTCVMVFECECGGCEEHHNYSGHVTYE